MALCFLLMRWGLLFGALLAMGGEARAEDARPRSIWLECKTPAVWPIRGTTPVRLTCRVESPVAAGPAFWQTVNPFVVEHNPELMDPFEAVPRYADVFESGRYARPRPQRPAPPPAPAPPRKPAELSDELMSPFEVYPDGAADTINPFDPPPEPPAGHHPAR